MNYKLLLLILMLIVFVELPAASVILYKTDATVWLPKQTLRGKLDGFTSSTVTIHHNDSTFSVTALEDGHFSFTIMLIKYSNYIHAEASHGNATIGSPTISLYLPYDPFPELYAQVFVDGNNIRLTPLVREDTVNMNLSFEWAAASSNPAPTTLKPSSNGSAVVDVPAAQGDYYFTLYTRKGETIDSFKTFIRVSDGDLKVFDPEKDKAEWIHKALIYQVTPYIFTKNFRYPDLETKLQELSSLGVNTIYLQPVFRNEHGGQGYHITDYFSLRTDIGTESELASLIRTAKSLNMRILFDMVPNHTSIHHPYALDKMHNGRNSHYYDFYQQVNDNAMYSMHYHQHPQGFIYYFWNELVNLNFNNDEVQRWMIEACKYWIRKFDIDGYRFDAVWGVNARTPSFGKRLQKELKSLKPGLLLIAEDKASPAIPYRQGFDAAYDWDKSIQWVSKWSWQYDYDDKNYHTIFNHPSPADRKSLMQKALFSDGDSIGLRLRFLENNDMHRFIRNHSRSVTKMAATLMFSLPGLLMLYNGQETGFRDFPYTSGPIYNREKSIRSNDAGLFDYYKHLALLRSSNEAMIYGNMTEIEMNGGFGAVAFLRKSDSQEIVVITNMEPASITPVLQYTAGEQIPGNGLIFTDLVTGDTILAKRTGSAGISIPVGAHTTRILLLNRNTVVLADP